MDKTPPAYVFANSHARLIWQVIAIMGAVTVASFIPAGLIVDVRSNPALLLFFIVVFAVNWFYRIWRPDAYVAAATEVAGQLLLILLFGILLSYAAATAKFPYVDAELYAIDNALGFDRRAYLHFFAHRPWLERSVGVAYLCMLPQFLVVPGVMFFAQQAERLQQMIIAVAVALLVTAAVSVFTPSLTAFVHVDLAQMPHVPAGLYTPERTMEALRAGTFGSVPLNNLEGLISFPSFHTTAALIFIWTVCKIPYVRWGALILNLALISATPIAGAHYFVDVLGGAAVAAAAIVVSKTLCRLMSRAAFRLPSPDIGAVSNRIATGR